MAVLPFSKSNTIAIWKCLLCAAFLSCHEDLQQKLVLSKIIASYKWLRSSRRYLNSSLWSRSKDNEFGPMETAAVAPAGLGSVLHTQKGTVITHMLGERAEKLMHGNSGAISVRIPRLRSGIKALPTFALLVSLLPLRSLPIYQLYAKFGYVLPLVFFF